MNTLRGPLNLIKSAPVLSFQFSSDLTDPAKLMAPANQDLNSDQSRSLTSYLSETLAAKRLTEARLGLGGRIVCLEVSLVFLFCPCLFLSAFLFCLLLRDRDFSVVWLWGKETINKSPRFSPLFFHLTLNQKKGPRCQNLDNKQHCLLSLQKG